MLWTGFTGRFWSNFEVRMVKFGRSLNQTRRPLSQTTDQTSRQLIKIPSQTSLRPVNLEHCRWQIIAQVEECAPPSVSGRQAGLERHAGARMGARAAILDCEASICNRELTAAPTPPRPPSRWQITAQVEACAPPSVSGWQAGPERHAGARTGGASRHLGL